MLSGKPVIQASHEEKYDIETLKANEKVLDHNGDNPLIAAVRNGKLQLLRVLVTECKYDINVNDRSGKTAAELIMEKYLPQGSPGSWRAAEKSESLRLMLGQSNLSQKTFLNVIMKAIENRNVPVSQAMNLFGNSSHVTLVKGLSMSDMFADKKIEFDLNLTNSKKQTLLHHLALHRSEAKDLDYAISMIELFKKHHPKLKFDVMDSDDNKPEDYAKSPLLKVYLKAERYIQQRAEAKDYKTKLSIFGYELASFGYSKDDKTAAAEELCIMLRKYMHDPRPKHLDFDALLKQKPALSVGDLGAIFLETRKLFETESKVTPKFGSV